THRARADPRPRSPGQASLLVAMGAVHRKGALTVRRRTMFVTGRTTAQVAFAEQRPIDVPSKLLVFNGGDRGGKVKLFIHAYFSSPISGAIVTTVTFKKIHHGRYGRLPTRGSRRSPAAAARSSRST
ncbi:MAG TPA: hypothetical protein VHB53_03660, partial [Solirubrobacterales bacterium]|nr:hypothetical protein [Solirubrobacterales bacterium]